MKKDILLTYLILGCAALIALWVVSRREHFVMEFLDRSNQNRDVASWSSSFAQKTNNSRAPDSHAPAVGQPTGHRVGLFEGHSP